MPLKKQRKLAAKCFSQTATATTSKNATARSFIAGEGDFRFEADGRVKSILGENLNFAGSYSTEIAKGRLQIPTASTPQSITIGFVLTNSYQSYYTAKRVY